MKERVEEIRIDKIIDSPWQGRLLSVHSQQADIVSQVKNIENSIKQNGVLQPIVVRKIGAQFELIDGHRRVLASKNLGLTTIRAIISTADDREAQIASIVSNVERKGLHPIEKAIAYRKILDNGVFETVTELAESMGKTTAYIGEILNNLNLDKRIIEDLVKNRNITDNRILRALRSLGATDNDGLSERQWNMYNRVIRENLTRNDLLKIIKKNRIVIRKKKVERKETKKNISFVINKDELTDAKMAQLSVIIEEYVRLNTSWSRPGGDGDES